MGVYKIELLSEVSTLGVWKIEESKEELLDLSKLNGKDYTSYLNFKSESRKIQWLGTRALLHHLIPESHIVYLSNGRPFLENSSCKISISHSENYIALLINQERECGIDIEKISPRINNIQHKFLHPSELEYINTFQKDEYLLTIWCAKEALFKYLNQKNFIFSKNIKILPFKLSEKSKLIGIHIQSNKETQVQLTLEKLDDFRIVYTH